MPFIPKSNSFNDYHAISPSASSPFAAYNLFGTLGKQYTLNSDGSKITLKSKYGFTASGAISISIAQGWEVEVKITANFYGQHPSVWRYFSETFISTENSKREGFDNLFLTLSYGDSVLIDTDKNCYGTNGIQILIGGQTIIENGDDLNIDCSIELLSVKKELTPAQVEQSVLHSSQLVPVDSQSEAPPSPPPSDGKIYSRTSNNRDDFVWTIQRFLAKKGMYLLKIDGIFGKGTEGAVKAWQTVLLAVAPSLPFTPDGVWNQALYDASLSVDVNQTVSLQTLNSYYQLRGDPSNYQNPFKKFKLFGIQMVSGEPGYGWDWTDGNLPASNPSYASTEWISSNQLLLGPEKNLGQNKAGVLFEVNRGWSVTLKIESEDYDYFNDNISVGIDHPLVSSKENIDNDSIIQLTLNGGDYLHIDNPNQSELFVLSLNGKIVSDPGSPSPSSASTISTSSCCWISIVDVKPPGEGWVGFGDSGPPTWGDDSGVSFIEKAISAFDHEAMIQRLNSNGDSITYKLEAELAVEAEIHGAIECKVSYVSTPTSMKYELESVWVAGIGEEAGTTKADISFFGFEEDSGVEQAAKLDAGWSTTYQFSSSSEAIRGLNIIIRSLAAGAASCAVMGAGGALASLALYELLSPPEADNDYLFSNRAKDKFSLTGSFSAEAGFEASAELWDKNEAAGASLKGSIGVSASRSIEFDWNPADMRVCFGTEGGLTLGASAQAGIWGELTTTGLGNASIEAKCEYSSSFPLNPSTQTIGDICGITINAIFGPSLITSIPSNLLSTNNILQVKLSGKLGISSPLFNGGTYEYEFVFASSASIILAAIAGLTTNGFSGMLSAIDSGTSITSFICKTEIEPVDIGLDVKVVGVGVKLKISALHADRPRNHWTYSGSPSETWSHFNAAFASLLGGGEVSG
jgi:hypothetical protein